MSSHHRHSRVFVPRGFAAYVAALGVIALAAAPLRAGGDDAIAAAGALTAAEQQLVATIDAGTPAAVDLLRRLVDVNSGTMNFAGVRRAGELVAPELEGLGFTTRWIDGTPFGRAGHLVAERPGTSGGPKVLLIGHLDTVFEADSPFQRFEPLDGERAKGPGTIDMKGGIVVMLEALRGLQAAGSLDRLHLVVVLHGDEEDSGAPLSLARADLIGAAQGAAYALGFEDGDGTPERAVIARRGSMDWQLRVTGTPAHSSQVFQPEVGAGAIYEMARILSGFYEELAGEPNLTFNPGVVVGGTTVTFDVPQARGTAFGKNNVVAGDVRLAGDLRTLSPEQLASAQERMRRIVAAHLPGTSAELTFAEGYPPMAPTDANRALLAKLDQASRDLGLGPVTAVDPRRAGAADVSFVSGIVPAILDALGLKGTGGHTNDETADLRTLPSQAKKAGLLLHRLATAP
jgi:glutamate carboxypeptidase